MPTELAQFGAKVLHPAAAASALDPAAQVKVVPDVALSLEEPGDERAVVD